MVKRGTKLAMAAIASVGGVIGGVIVGGKLYLHYQVEREDHLGVTLYSEPHYRGRSQALTRAGNPESFLSLRDVGLVRVGSVRVERITQAFRPALLDVPAVWGWARSAIISTICRDYEQARESGYYAANLLPTVLKPSMWRADPDLVSHRRSWVRLWADRPTHPVPPCDNTASARDQPWYEVATDIPDLGPWSRRTRYLEFGVSNA